jgi:exodeoxyribonuclease-1
MEDERFTSLFFNYRARNYPEFLSKEEKETWAAQRERVLTSMLPDYLSNLDSLATEYAGNESKSALIKNLQRYASSLASELK